MTHYEALELPPNAPAADIRRAYRRLVLVTHPDRTPDPAAHARYLAINAAYETLSDPARRQAYDFALRWPAPAAAPPVSPGRARDGRYQRHRRPAARPPRTPPPPPFKNEQARFLRVARPIMLAALVLCAALLVDLIFARTNKETILRTEGKVHKHLVHYTDGGTFVLEEELPPGTWVWVRRTPLWRTAVSAEVPETGEQLEFSSLYHGSSNFFWLGLALTSFVGLSPRFSSEQRLMSCLTGVVFLVLTLLQLLKS